MLPTELFLLRLQKLMSRFTMVTWVIWWSAVVTVAISCSLLGIMSYAAVTTHNIYYEVSAVLMWLSVVMVLVLGRKRNS